MSIKTPTEHRDPVTGRMIPTHGMDGTPIYKTWISLKARCLNPNDAGYPRYGGRGIFVCDRWLESFENFYADMGPRPKGCTIDRIDNDGPYSPENCRWATMRQQGNNRSNNTPVTLNGITRNITQWSRRIGVTKSTIRERLKRGWSIEDALTKKSTCPPPLTITYNGQTKTLKEWAGGDIKYYKLMHCRLQKGWEAKHILFGKV